MPCHPLDPASDLTFRWCDRAFSGAAGGRLDIYAGRARWWPAFAASVARAARPRQPPAPRALFRAGWAARMCSRGRAGTACRRLPCAVGRIVLVWHSCQICIRRCYHSPNISLRSVKLLSE
eukprot:6833549-Prymnesium_polylepis.1